jgi:hypothetical protein
MTTRSFDMANGRVCPQRALNVDAPLFVHCDASVKNHVRACATTLHSKRSSADEMTAVCTSDVCYQRETLRLASVTVIMFFWLLMHRSRSPLCFQTNKRTRLQLGVRWRIRRASKRRFLAKQGGANTHFSAVYVALSLIARIDTQE